MGAHHKIRLELPAGAENSVNPERNNHCRIKKPINILLPLKYVIVID